MASLKTSGEVYRPHSGRPAGGIRPVGPGAHSAGPSARCAGNSASGIRATRIEKLVLDAAQTDIPACSRPFEALGAGIGVTGADVLKVLKTYKKKGVVRRIGGSFETRKLGFSSTLAGARVKLSRLAAVAKEISKFPGVTHCYERAGEMNLWFTVGVRGTMAGVNRQIAVFRRLPGVEKCYSFPVKTMFKIKTFFPI